MPACGGNQCCECTVRAQRQVPPLQCTTAHALGNAHHALQRIGAPAQMQSNTMLGATREHTVQCTLVQEPLRPLIIPQPYYKDSASALTGKG
jgi:hypothetical protein